MSTRKTSFFALLHKGCVSFVRVRWVSPLRAKPMRFGRNPRDSAETDIFSKKTPALSVQGS